MTLKPVFRYDMTIEEIGVAGNQYIESVWKTLYDSMFDELTIAFREIEDAAYGLYLDQLMPAHLIALKTPGSKQRSPSRSMISSSGNVCYFAIRLKNGEPRKIGPEFSGTLYVVLMVNNLLELY